MDAMSRCFWMHLIELDKLQVGERLKKVRGNLSQTAFAKELGLDRQSIARYESGNRVIDANVIFILMVKFNIDPTWLLTGEGNTLDLTNDEQELLLLFRSSPLAVKAAALGALTAGMAQQKTGVNISNNSIHNGQIAGGNIYTLRRQIKNDNKS